MNQMLKHIKVHTEAYNVLRGMGNVTDSFAVVIDRLLLQTGHLDVKMENSPISTPSHQLKVGQTADTSTEVLDQ